MKNYLHHVHVFCSDLQPMIDFWQQVLGASFVEFRRFGDADGAVLDLNSVSKIFLKKVVCAPQDKVERAGVNHLGVMVQSLDAALDAARSFPGAAVIREPFMSGVLRCGFVTGPEGVVIEVMEEKK